MSKKSQHPNTGNTNSSGAHHHFETEGKVDKRRKANHVETFKCLKPKCKVSKRVTQGGGARGGLLIEYTKDGHTFAKKNLPCVLRG